MRLWFSITLLFLLGSLSIAQSVSVGGVKPGGCPNGTELVAISVSSPPTCKSYGSFLNYRFLDVVPGPPVAGGIIAGAGSPTKWGALPPPQTGGVALLHISNKVIYWSPITPVDIANALAGVARPLLNTSACSDCAAGTPITGGIVNAVNGQWTASTSISPTKLNGMSVCDGVVNTTLNAANFGNPPVIIIPQGSSCPVSGAVFIAPSQTVYFMANSSLSIPTGATLEMFGAIVAPLTQNIFNISGTGAVELRAFAYAKFVSPTWFGMVCNGSTDDTPALNATIAAIKNFGRAATIQLPANTGCTIAGNIVADATIGLTIQGPTDSNPGLPGGQTELTVTTNTGPIISCSGCQGFTLQNVYLNSTSTSFSGVGVELGPSPSQQTTIKKNTFLFSTTPSNVVALSLNQALNTRIEDNVFSDMGTGGVMIRGAVNNTSYANTGVISNNTFGTAVAASNTILQNLSANWDIFANDFELGNGSPGAVVLAYTSGTWNTFGVQGIHMHANFMADAGSSNTQTLITVPAGCSSIIFEANEIAPQSTSSNVFSIGNNCTGIVIEANAQPSGTMGTFLALGTGDVVTVLNNGFLGTVTTFLSGTPATGSDVTDNNGNRTVYGPLKMQFPDVKTVPAANCNSNGTTVGTGWSLGSTGTCTCRAGTNNKGGFCSITDTSTTFAQFQVEIPEDWSSTIGNPYIRLQIASTDTTSGHTIIPQIQVSCAKGDGTTTDDVTFNAAHSVSTVTLNTTANQFWSTANVQMNATDVTGCVAGGIMIIQVGRATDTATNAEFYSATVTFPRNTVMQAN